MKELLEAIKTQLQDDGSLNYIDDINIFITPDVDIIPVSATFPAVGLKDGPIDHLVEEAENWEVTLRVDIVLLQLLKAGETPLMGQDNPDPRIYGLLEMRDDIHNSLNDNKLSITGMELAYPVKETESETVGYEDLVLQRKIITYEYIKLEERP